MVDIDKIMEDVRKHLQDHQDNQSVNIVCSSGFFNSLVNHWRLRVIDRARQEFSDEIVVVSMAQRNRWKLRGKTSGKIVKIKRAGRITAEMEPVFTVET